MKKFLAIVFLLNFTTSCVETVAVGTVATAIIVTREKTVKATADDITIAAKIDKEFLLNGLKGVKNFVSVSVDEGRVLLTGVVREPEVGKWGVEATWKIEGVKEVIDEIEINEKGVEMRDFNTSFIDSYVTSAIKTKLFFTPKISPSNYKITTFNGVVYLLGVYKQEGDLKKLLDIVSHTRGVKKVVNYVISINDSRRK